MKIILTGATGFIGGAVLRQCLTNDNISHVFVLTRKPLPEAVSGNGKVTVIIHDDFSTYSPEVLEKVAGAEGCIWAVGGRATQFSDVNTAKKVSVDYTIAAAKAFIAALAPELLSRKGNKFRFVFCSGKFAEWDQQKRLSFMSDTRHIKGQVERGLCELADANADRFEVWCARPSGVLPTDAGLATKAIGKLYGAIGVDHLASAMIKVCLQGYPQRIIENDELLRIK
ncbi:hypothetical protein VTK73DRAFT_268 [Phialemonium thermophilum]|uniref:NAD(P)-binding domain-containing protein n=1 Tax=Phialemonium thermophilum TaxID=223376 RepID=A0ABR3XGF2_9PEZI